MGWGDVGFNGHPVIRTPHLDAMSREGVRFDRFYAPTVCSPTRGSCLTGRHPFRYGIVNANVGRLPPSEHTLAEQLKAVGYTTGHFGKWHLGTLTNDIQDGRRGGRDTLAYSPPWMHGFDAMFSTEQAVPTWDPAISQPFLTKFWTGPGKYATENLEGDASRVVMDRAVDFIRQAVTDKKPFLTYIWFHAPHQPFKAGEAHRQLYAEQRGREQHYFGCITALDEQMGRLRAELADLGIADQTILWFVSDNGPEGNAGQAPGSAGPLRGRKRDLWEGGIRVPGVLEYPAVLKSAQKIDTPCVTSDFVPTILDFVGVEPTGPGPLDGVSIRPLLEGKPFQRPQGIGFEYSKMASRIDQQYKLVALLEEPPREDRKATKAAKAADADQNQPPVRQGKIKPATSDGITPIKQYLLFDIASDPAEQHDLAEKFPERVQEMSSALAAWRQSCRDSYVESRARENSETN